MWGKYCRIYPELATTKKKNKKKPVLYLKYSTTNIRTLTV
jgi:hypothetical protein